MLDLRISFVRPLKEHNVKAAGPVRQMVPGQILGGQLNQLLLFPSMDGMDRPAEFFSSSCLHLDKYQNRTVFGHQVQFPQRGTEILLDNPITLSTEIPLGCCFSFLPKEPSGVKDCHTIVRRDFCLWVGPCASGSGNRPISSAIGAKLLRWMGHGP